MREIVALLQSIAPVISARTMRQLSQVVYGMLISNGRITMLELSRWTEKGGSYRTIQRLYHTPILWLQIHSKFRSDAALFEPFTGKYCGHGPHPTYGDKVDLRRMKKKYLKTDETEAGIRTQIYQAVLLNREFAAPINVVVILKTNLSSKQQTHVILFSTDLELSYQKLYDYYTLRFQIEFNFRDARQYWGLNDFMNVKQTAVTNAANLSFFMANFSSALLRTYRKNNPDFSVLDLKSHYRGHRYVAETIKMLPQKPDAILLPQIFLQIARLGMVHPTFEPVSRMGFKLHSPAKAITRPSAKCDR